MPKKTGNPDKIICQKPGRTFEKSGLVNPEASYYVPLENVVNSDKQDIKTMVDLEKGKKGQAKGNLTFIFIVCIIDNIINLYI